MNYIGGAKCAAVFWDKAYIVKNQICDCVPWKNDREEYHQCYQKEKTK